MTDARRIQVALFGAFALPPPPRPPVPAGPERFPILFARPALTALNPLRLAIGGTVTIPKR